ncbi:MAG: hypothetical protein ACYC2R_06375 [Burkholderiales bacterium]
MNKVTVEVLVVPLANLTVTVASTLPSAAEEGTKIPPVAGVIVTDPAVVVPVLATLNLATFAAMEVTVVLSVSADSAGFEINEYPLGKVTVISSVALLASLMDDGIASATVMALVMVVAPVLGTVSKVVPVLDAVTVMPGALTLDSRVFTPVVTPVEVEEEEMLTETVWPAVIAEVSIVMPERVIFPAVEPVVDAVTGTTRLALASPVSEPSVKLVPVGVAVAAAHLAPLVSDRITLPVEIAPATFSVITKVWPVKAAVADTGTFTPADTATACVVSANWLACAALIGEMPGTATKPALIATNAAVTLAAITFFLKD